MLKQLKAILSSHQGKHNPITSAEIASTLGIKEDDTHAKTRALILECAQKYNLPVAAGGRGYYLITCQDEFNDYIANLDSRMEGIEERKKIITNNFKKEQ